MGPTPRASAPDIPGVELAGVIGSGGSGVVYLGRQQGFGRDVAVKVAARGSAPEDAVRRWEREVSAIGRLSNHPNIVPVFDAGITDDGSPYLVMPYVPGGTLSDRLREEGPMPAEQVAVVGAKLAGALATVHAAGVLHRDVKPDNVLWSPHGEPQLTDFGIARLQDLSTTTSDAVHATIAYAAPEVLAGQPATEAADLYGLGATLHACLTGAAPYATDGDNLGVLVARVLEQPPASLRDAGVPAALAEVVERAMQRDPAQRHGSAGELREALVSVPVAGAAPVSARTEVLPPSAPEPPPTAPQPVVVAPPTPPPASPADRDPLPHNDTGPPRSRLLWLAIGAVLLLFGGLLAYGLARDDDPGAAADPTTTDPPATDPTEPPAGEETPESTEAPATTTPTTTEATTTTSDSDSDSPASDDAAMVEEAEGWFALLQEGRFDDAWGRTTNRFQNNQDRDAWESFWSGFRQISVVGDPTADPDSGSVVVPLELDGQREDYSLEMRRQGGDWRVDGPVGNPTGGDDDD